MNKLFVFAGLFLFAAISRAQDAVLSIEPDPYVSSDSVTICRVVARNPSPHTLDGRTIAFEAQAWENGALVARERGRFRGAVAPGQTAETRIGFDGVFQTLTVVPIAPKEVGRRGGSKRGGRSAGRGGKKRTTKSSRPKKSGR